MKKNRLFSITFFFIFPLFAIGQCVSGNCISGTGTYVYPSGAKYIGEFKNGRMKGQGICTYSDGSKFQGTWEDGYPNGKGKKVLSNGQEWVGNWRKGRPVDAQGKTVDIHAAIGDSGIAQPKMKSQLTDKTAKDEGCISGNCMEGWGIYVYRNQSARYEGRFQAELPNGQGTITYDNGDKYEGEWVAGNFEGQGVLTLAEGTEIGGFWKDGVHIGDRNPFQLEPNIIQNPLSLASMKVWAVVIGVSTYNHMPSLRFTDDDAYRIYAFLKSPEGGALPDNNIKVLVDEEATRSNILNALQNTFSKAGSNDLVLLYFSGHGLQGSFLPNDYDGFNNKILHDEIKDILDNSPAKYKLCIADACHSGGLFTMKNTEAQNALVKYYEALSQSSPGSALILSSKSTETSLESSGLRQGVFSHFLIRGMKGEADTNFDKIVTVQELFDFTYMNVRSYTGSRQTPVMKGNFDKMMPASVIR